MVLLGGSWQRHPLFIATGQRNQHSRSSSDSAPERATAQPRRYSVRAAVNPARITASTLLRAPSTE
jgi:hypothetical protein